MPEDGPNLQEALAGLDGEALDALRGPGLASVPHLPASNEGLQAEFFARTYAYARSWLLENGNESDKARPCAFVLSRAIQQDITRLGAEIVHYLDVSPDHDVTGSLFIANDDLSVVAVLPDVVCKSLAEIATALKSTALHEEVHSIFRPHRGELILCRHGVLGARSVIRIELGEAKRLSQLDLEREIWAFHRQFTQTPSGYLLCWKGKTTNRVTIEQLERQISGLLAFYLRGVVGFDNVNMEHYTPHGRIDVSLIAAAMLPGLGACALELKVLRSRKHANSAKGWATITPEVVLEHALEGVGQAVDYRNMIHANIAYLCCFDARLVDEDQLEVVAHAAAEQVHLRRYFMYDSPKAYRAAKAAANKAGVLLSGEVD